MGPPSGRSARLGDDGAGAGADAASLSGARSPAAWPCPPSPRPMSPSRWTRRCNIGAGAAAIGKAESRPRCGRQGAYDDGRPRLFPARRTGMRTFRSRRGCSATRIAARSSPSIASRAPPTTSPIIRLCRLTASSRCSTVSTLRCAAAERPIPRPSRLRLALGERGLEPTHALDLLDAFRLDVRKNRYADWAELMDYCRLSAAPVGRFVLDVHGEDRTIWPASDALCAALQVNNHLQDCALGLSPPRSRLPAAGHPRRAWRLGRDAGRAHARPGPARRHRRDRPPRRRVDRARASADPPRSRTCGSLSRSPPSRRWRAVSRAISKAAIR